MENKYEAVIGLEIHAQLKTKSKMFCCCDNDAEGKEPNTVVCPVCMGFPGALPVPNKKAIEWTILLGLALGAEIAPTFNFERKNYFYPDLPKGYQITSQTGPPVKGGELEIEVGKGKKTIRFNHIHLEEDAGKLVHPENSDFSLVDLNRAGTPLLEIVTEPDIFSAEEAKIFMQELQRILRYLDISFADMEKGHLRADANISLRPLKIQAPNSKAEIQNIKLGTKVEIKNINSFSALERALNYEIERQRDVLESGEKVIQETRGWDDARGRTFSQRTKEMAHDYRYFPEPDIPEIIPKELFGELKKQIPVLPAQKREDYRKKGFSDSLIQVVASDPIYFKPFESSFSKFTDPQDYKIYDQLFMLSGWPLIKEGKELSEWAIANIAATAVSIRKGEVTGNIAKQYLSESISTGVPLMNLLEQKGIKEISGDQELEVFVDQVINENPEPVADYKAGKEQALQFLMGQVMKKTRGQANPAVTQEILKKKLRS